MLTSEKAKQKYGIPNKTGAGYLVTIILPFPMRLAWDRMTKIHAFQCHKDIASRLLGVFKDLLAHYGYERLVELGIDLYGGCFNYRAMRGGTSLSIHSWGLAVDIDPDRNLLKETKATARFARPEYIPMHEIFYKHGFENLGIEKDYDFMHYQIRENPNIPVMRDFNPLNDYKTTSPLNLRKGAGVNFPITIVIPSGAKVDELARCDAWSNIEYNGLTGWVSNQYLIK